MAAETTVEPASWKGTIHANTIHTALAQAGMAYMTKTKVDTVLNALDAAGLLVVGPRSVSLPAPAWGGPKPPITVLCGSTRFVDDFNRQAKELTQAGHIVLSIEIVTTQARDTDPQHTDPALKAALDELHKRKIDLADEVLVLNVGGYIGQSTRSEVEYAETLGRPIRYLEPVA